MATPEEINAIRMKVKANQLRAKVAAAKEAAAKTSSTEVPFMTKAKDFASGALKNNSLEMAGAAGGGLLGGTLGATAGGIGAIPGAIAGSGLGAGIGNNLEDFLLGLLGEEKYNSLPDQIKSDISAVGAGAASEMTGQIGGKVLQVAGDKILSPAGKGIKNFAKRVMTSTVKDADLAEDMISKGQWGTAKNLAKEGAEGVTKYSDELSTKLSQINQKVDRMNVIDELEDLRREYAALPGRESEVARIEELMGKIFKSPGAKAVKKGMTDYSKLTPTAANELKKNIYAENSKLYKGGNYDPASLTAQSDMAISRGLKKAVEDVLPEAKVINKDIGKNIMLRDTMENLAEKGAKSNLVQLRPLLGGLGLLSQGAPAGALAATGSTLMGSTLGGTGAAVAMDKIGKNLMTRSGTPGSNFFLKMLAEAELAKQNEQKHGVPFK